MRGFPLLDRKWPPLSPLSHPQANDASAEIERAWLLTGVEVMPLQEEMVEERVERRLEERRYSVLPLTPSEPRCSLSGIRDRPSGGNAGREHFAGPVPQANVRFRPLDWRSSANKRSPETLWALCSHRSCSASAISIILAPSFHSTEMKGKWACYRRR